MRSIVVTVAHGVVPDRRLTAQHDGARAVEHGVGDVGHLGPRGHLRVRHRLEHLGRHHDGAGVAHPVRTISFWRCGTSSMGRRTPRSPRATMIASETVDDLVEVLDAFAGLDLGHHHDVVARAPCAPRPCRRPSARRRPPGSRTTPSAAPRGGSRSSSVGSRPSRIDEGSERPGLPMDDAARAHDGPHGLAGGDDVERDAAVADVDLVTDLEHGQHVERSTYDVLVVRLILEAFEELDLGTELQRPLARCRRSRRGSWARGCRP
jgi:hypothetical protein